jgi:uncharacterized protein
MMNRRVKRVLVLVLGWTFILVGIAGLFLPILQGILCLLIGLTILSSEYVWAHHLLQKLKTRFPKIAALSEQATEKAQAWLARITHRHKRQSASCESAESTEAETAGSEADER